MGAMTIKISTTADAILEFVSLLNGKTTPTDAPPQWVAGGLGVVGISAVVASLVDWLPAF